MCLFVEVGSNANELNGDSPWSVHINHGSWTIDYGLSWKKISQAAGFSFMASIIPLHRCLTRVFFHELIQKFLALVKCFYPNTFVFAMGTYISYV